MSSTLPLRDPASVGAPDLIDLVAEEWRELCLAVTAGRNVDSAPLGTYVLAADDPRAVLAETVEGEVFLSSFGKVADFAEYLDASFFLCVIDHREMQPAGVARVILPGPAGLKTLRDLEHLWGVDVDDVVQRSFPGMDVTRTWDVASLAVLPAHRRSVVSNALFQACFVASVRFGVDWFVTVLDDAIVKLFERRFRGGFATFDGIGPRLYDGSLSVPIGSDVRRYRAALAERDPARYQVLFEARGLEGRVSGPDPDDFAAVVPSRAQRLGVAAG